MAASKKKVAQKLDELMVSFGDFESSMKEGTRQRREQDENRLLELKKEMTELEMTVSTEIKRRIEVNKALQSWCGEELDGLRDSLHAKVDLRTERMDKNLKMLADRMADFEGHFEQEKRRITTEIRERNRKLKNQLAEFIKTFEAEKEDRLRREAALVKRLADHEQEVATRFANERKEREDKHQDLRDRLEDETAARRKSDERFQEYVTTEVSNISNGLDKEASTREAEDDEIVEAMNRYTRKLQQSLKIINSTET